MKDDSLGNLIGGGTCLGILTLNLAVGGIATDYALEKLLAVEIHWVGDVLIGLVAGQVMIPVAFVCLILSVFGLDAPFLR